MEPFDYIKLTAPFATAILMVWIKSYIELRLQRKSKSVALSRVIDEEVAGLAAAISALRRMAEGIASGKLRMRSIDVSSTLCRFSADLSDLDVSRAYLYAKLEAAVEIVNKDIQRLESAWAGRLSDKENAPLINQLIVSQTSATASNLIHLCRCSIAVVKELPPAFRYQDAQALAALEQAVKAAVEATANWPTRDLSASSKNAT